MTDYVKHVPAAAVPAGGVAVWKVVDAERWLRARTPGVFAPVAGSRLLAAPVLCSLVLLALSAGGEAGRGTLWWAFVPFALLAALPLWFRFLPLATLVATPAVAVAAAALFPSLDPGDTPGRTGCLLAVALGLWAFAGASLRLRSRARRRALALEAAGGARFPVPDGLARAHHRRGLRPMALGAGLCLVGAAFLVGGLALDLRGRDAAVPYDAVGQQGAAVLLLVPGTTLLGRGVAARRAVRLLHAGPQPALVVGVRNARITARHWLYPGADSPHAPPLIAYATSYRDVVVGQRLLVAGSQETLRGRHHDIDSSSEPYEAVLYGVPVEGSEVVLECAVYGGDTRIVSHVTAVPLLPHRRHGLTRWRAAGASHREEARRAEARRKEERERREQERRAARSDRSESGAAGGCGGGCGSGCGGCGCG
ncbi:hypothetical protein ACFWUQ_06050 [Streptomyces sp. NPDC058662]|uniref:hypothetical protein n=1 Tax=Streptomyces sp. NPDC058662 TaxID=3346583 RepID=UPI003659BED7